MPRKKRKTASSGKKRNLIKKAGTLDLVRKSVVDLKSNPAVMLPGIFGLVVVLAFYGFIIIQYFVALSFLKSLDPENRFIFAFLAFVVLLLDMALLIVINAYYYAMQYGMIADVLSGRKTSLRRGIMHGKTLFVKMLSLSIAKSVFSKVIPMVILISIFIPVFLVDRVAALITAIILLSFVYLPYLTVFWVVTVFKLPILIHRNIPGVLSGFGVIFECFRYAKKDRLHVAIAFLVSLGISVIINAVLLVAGTYAYLIESVVSTDEFSPQYLTYFVLYLVKAAIVLVGSMIVSFFIFNSYFQKNRLRWK